MTPVFGRVVDYQYFANGVVPRMDHAFATAAFFKNCVVLCIGIRYGHWKGTVIISFKDGDTEALSNGFRISRFTNFEGPARRKLEYLKAVVKLDDLRVPPGNRLEALKGDRAGQHSIRINDQFRICFTWTDGQACAVEITDYH